MTGPRIVDLISSLCTLKAREEVIGDLISTARAALLEKCLAFKEAEGGAPTLRVKGLGMAILSDPQPAVAIANQTEFETWAAQAAPTEVTTLIRVDPREASLVLDLLEGAGITARSIATEVNSAWTKQTLEACAVVEHEGVEQILAPETGQICDFLTVRPAGSPSISVRLDPEAKARAKAEAGDPAAAAVLATPLGELASAREVRDRVDVLEHPELEPADGEPDGEGEREPGPYSQRLVVLEELVAIPRAKLESGLKVAELRDLAARLNLATSGNKTQLVDRLLKVQNDYVEAAAKVTADA